MTGPWHGVRATLRANAGRPPPSSPGKLRRRMQAPQPLHPAPPPSSPGAATCAARRRSSPQVHPKRGRTHLGPSQAMSKRLQPIACPTPRFPVRLSVTCSTCLLQCSRPPHSGPSQPRRSTRLEGNLTGFGRAHPRANFLDAPALPMTSSPGACHSNSPNHFELPRACDAGWIPHPR